MSDSSLGANVAHSRPRDGYALAGGVFLLLSAAATAAMVAARIASDTDQPTMAESLRAVEDNRALYGIAGFARFLSGAALLLAASFLLRTWIIRERFGTPLVPRLFLFSGVITAISGVCAVVIAIYPNPLVESGAGGVPAFVEAVSDIRWIAGKIGFAAAGAALLAAATQQWKVGGALRRIAPASAVIGAAMQLIWIDAATLMHPIVGATFFFWLLGIGTMLATGRVERRFIAVYGECA